MISQIDEKAIELFQQEYDTLVLALAKHRTHRNKKISFERRQYLKELYFDNSDYIVLKKATQNGATEWLVVRAISKAIKGRSILYALPTWELKNRFVKNRFDRSIMYSEFYQSIIREGVAKQAESASLKHIGQGSIAFVGSNTPNAFIEYPADDLIIDELDNCNQENIEMADERLSASEHKQVVKVGNPTVSNYGIDLEYQNSDCKIWNIKHDCGNWINPDFFIHVVRREDDNYVIIDGDYDKESGNDINCICDKCGKPFDRFSNGAWTPTRESDISGYHISKMFSTNITVRQIVDRFERGLSNDTALQRFYNGDLGLAYTASGAKISAEMLDACIDAGYNLPQSSAGPCVMGVDVGAKLHVIISEMIPGGKRKAVYIGSVHDETDIVDLWNRYRCKVGVIDALPETRMSRKLCTRLGGLFMCNYIRGVKDSVDGKNKIVKVDRTSALDRVKEVIVKQEIILPRNARSIDEFYDHMKASTRVFNENNQHYEWVESGQPDHFHHAFNYCLIAEKLLMML